MNAKAIAAELVDHGRSLFDAAKKVNHFTHDADANSLINDLAEHPHAFVLACIMDRQIKAETAWLIPYRISQMLGDFTIATLGTLSSADIQRLMTDPKPLHRFAVPMSKCFWSGVQRIIKQYGGNASRIWDGRPSSAEVIYRFLEFDGVGPKIANMATNALVREFKIPLADYYSIDVSADVHVRRVVSRLGLCAYDATVEQVTYKAKALHPEFPGLMDFPCWEIGRNWCKARSKNCAGCYMKDLCPSREDGEQPVSQSPSS